MTVCVEEDWHQSKLVHVELNLTEESVYFNSEQ